VEKGGRVKHELISLAGWAALACRLLVLGLVPRYANGGPGAALLGAIVLAALVLTSFRVRDRFW
jgi:hypothetical protein